GLPERVACLARMQLPRDHHVAGRVADPHRTPIDDGADASVPYEPVAHVDVAVVPNRLALPRRRRKRTLPFRSHRRVAVAAGPPVADLPVALAQGNAAAGR